MSSPPAIVPVGPCVRRFILTQVLLRFGLELPRRGSEKGVGFVIPESRPTLSIG